MQFENAETKNNKLDEQLQERIGKRTGLVLMNPKSQIRKGPDGFDLLEDFFCKFPYKPNIKADIIQEEEKIENSNTQKQIKFNNSHQQKNWFAFIDETNEEEQSLQKNKLNNQNEIQQKEIKKMQVNIQPKAKKQNQVEQQSPKMTKIDKIINEYDDNLQKQKPKNVKITETKQRKNQIKKKKEQQQSKSLSPNKSGKEIIISSPPQRSSSREKRSSLIQFDTKTGGSKVIIAHQQKENLVITEKQQNQELAKKDQKTIPQKKQNIEKKEKKKNNQKKQKEQQKETVQDLCEYQDGKVAKGVLLIPPKINTLKIKSPYNIQFNVLECENEKIIFKVENMDSIICSLNSMITIKKKESYTIQNQSLQAQAKIAYTAQLL